MRYAIIGFGPIGKALARAFARSGIAVSVATTRNPAAFAAEAAAIGPEVIATTLSDAVAADIIFLAVRFESHASVANALPSWQGKTIVDATNTYGITPEQLDGLTSSQFIARAFAGAKLVKGFNHLVAAILERDPAVNGGRRVVFLASEDESAATQVGELAETLGFAPIMLGGLAEGGLLVHARDKTWGRLIFKDLIKVD